MSLYGKEYYVKTYYSPESVDENDIQSVEIYPNPAKDLLTIKADNLSDVVIYNSVGQKVFAKTPDSSELLISLNDFDTGIYFVRLVADGNEITRKISVIK